MPIFRRIKGIIDDNGDPKIDADVIMTALVLGFTAWRLGDPQDGESRLKPLETGPVRFDADAGANEGDMCLLMDATGRVKRAVEAYLQIDSPKVEVKVSAGKAGAWSAGACIMGVYTAADQTEPKDIAKLEKLSKAGEERWNAIKDTDKVKQYIGRGAYTGFVDDPNGQFLAGPLSTARFWAAGAAKSPVRWLPPDLVPEKSPPWLERVPPTFAWGLIGGDQAKAKPPKPSAQQITDDMKNKGMVFNGEEAANGVDVAMYTHGMIQAIYLAYEHGPSCRPYEIAVGKETTKMASCFPCTMFMSANGYFPNSIHLGRGESWAPLFAPYHENDGQPCAAATYAVIRDLNNSWYERCLLWLKKGLKMLTPDELADEVHTKARDALAQYVIVNNDDETLGGRLVLDALTMHDSEQARLRRTLRPAVYI